MEHILSTTNPRQAAVEILMRIKREKSYADILIDQELSKGVLRGPDRGLLTELVYGVSRRRETLDHIINQFSNQKTDKLEYIVLTLLRLGSQSHFLDESCFCCGQQTVNLAKVYAPQQRFHQCRAAPGGRDRKGIVVDRTDTGKFIAVYYCIKMAGGKKSLRQFG
jgi:transcription termination factor NusB